MNIITVDFETYYSQTYSLSKMTTEEYVRGDEFEVIGIAVKVNNEETEWFSGTKQETKKWLDKFNWADSFVLAHNTQFDGAILSWLFNIKPKAWLDTLCMARAVHGVDAGGSLKALAERYEIGEKGTEVLNALGKHRADFDAEQLARYGDYCKNDVDLTYTLFNMMMLPGVGDGFPKQELKVIDVTLRMYIEPTLQLDLLMLEQHLEDVKTKKEMLLEACVADKDTLMSNDKFAELLKTLGVVPPRKISATTGREAWAFAKTDEAFKELASHPDSRVQALVSARLGNKTTLEETRTQRFIDIAKRGRLPVPIKYYAAHTGRWGGDDKINLQNLPSRGQNGGKLKRAIIAPDGYQMIDSDSSQIEARTVAWLAGQDDLVEAFDRGEDVYKIMASAIYQKDVEDVTKEERFVGKTTILGAGYGMGAKKFQAQLQTFGVEIEEGEAQRIITVYRETYPEIPKLWKQAQRCLEACLNNNACSLGREGVLEFDPSRKGFKLPSGLWQRYEGLRKEVDSTGKDNFVYFTRKGLVKMYGGKVVENICQALARCVIAEQMLRIAKRYKVVLTVHDAVACIAPIEEIKEAQAYVEECMRWRPLWAQSLPLNCESGIGNSYGEC
jgi:DNA polymerase I-like protein with 3'-5' exonuclease and polymerase domains